MKYEVGTKFHTYANRTSQQGCDIDNPMYGEILEIDTIRRSYLVRWNYYDGLGDFNTSYTDESFNYVLGHFGENDPVGLVRIEFPSKPFELFDEELFTI